MAKTKFSFGLWRWTTAEESLFNLSKDELSWYKLMVTEAEGADDEDRALWRKAVSYTAAAKNAVNV